MNSALKPFTRGRWSQCAPLEIARSHCPVVTYGGKVYGFGGGAENFRSLNSVVIYDPQRDAWSTGTDMPTLRSGAVPMVVDDKVYVMGGGFKQPNGNFRFLKDVDIYDPRTDSWEKGPDLLEPHDYPAVAFVEGYLYVMGGHHPKATEAGPNTDPGFEFCERWNPRTGAGWEEIAPLPTPRFALSAVALNGHILTMGGVAFTPEGFNNFDHIEVYDPATDRWTRHPELALPWPAAGQGVCLMAEQLFVFGGYSGDGICDRAACYDLKQRQWYQLPPMPTTLAAMGVAVHGRTAYLIGGWPDDRRIPTNEVCAFHLD